MCEHKFDINSDQVSIVAAQLKVLSNPDRLKILCLLIDGELNVQSIEEQTQIHQPTLSQQLTVLRKSDMVNTRRDGKMIFYRVDNPKVLIIMQTFHELYCHNDLAVL